jgi:hypothetical protein
MEIQDKIDELKQRILDIEDLSKKKEESIRKELGAELQAQLKKANSKLKRNNLLLEKRINELEGWKEKLPKLKFKYKETRTGKAELDEAKRMINDSKYLIPKLKDQAKVFQEVVDKIQKELSKKLDPKLKKLEKQKMSEINPLVKKIMSFEKKL